MIAEVKGARLLRGLRGRPAADLEALEDAVSHLAMHLGGSWQSWTSIRSWCLPRGQDVKAVDALVVLRGA